MKNISNRTILIIEDSEVDSYFISCIFKEANTIIANNSKDGFAILNSNNIDIILLDIELPDINGLDFAKEIQKNPKLKDIPIIFISANNNEDLILESLELGAKDFIVKPFNPRILRIKVKNHIFSHIQKKIIMEEKEKFETLLQNATDYIQIVDENGNLIMYSDSFIKNLGYSEDEALKLNIKDWNATEESNNPNYVKKMMNVNNTYQTIHKRKDGTTFNVHVIV